ncbi:hypothetical protein B0T10DRAFT_494172 [Thelonectria olida]|uniref:Uncharacterized protein n=1 Tax=Thelonectria olida TaxID=1576542 RepID=A0A9P9ALY8_9HYPO|nr:hypothetical protein B0T10DRAFT_494172 [Thelonectria olida]
MVNALYIIYALAAVASVEACKKTCTATTSSGSTCNYNCTNACESYPTKDARDDFLAALQNAGYSCSAVATNRVKCKKTSGFGGCSDHHWSCGSGC